jgi:ABC-type multidrug transport system permease subunit
MRSWIIIVKDFTRRARDPWSLTPILLLPLVIAGAMHLSFGRLSDGELPRAILFLADEDGELGGQVFRGALAQDQLAELIEVREVTASEGREAIENGEGSGFLVIPPGFTDSLLAGHPVELRLIRNPAQQFLPEILEEALGILAFVLAKGSLVFEEPLQRIHEAATDTGTGAPGLHTQEISSLIGEAIERTEEFLFPPLITVHVEELEAEESRTVPMSALFFPAMIPLALFFLADLAIRDTVREFHRGTLRRIMTTPTSMVEFLLGKLASGVLMGIMMFALLALLGALLFHIDWGRSPGALVVLVASFLLAAAGIELVIYAFMRTEQGGAALSHIVVMLMGLVGGSIVPQQFFPPVLEKVKFLSIAGWALAGVNELVWQGGTFSAVSWEIFVLLGCGIVTIVVGSRGMLRKLSRPAA